MDSEGSAPDTAFRGAMADVRPLEQHRVHQPSRTKKKTAVRYRARQAAAAGLGARDHASSPFSLDATTQVGPEEIMSWKRDGVQRSVLKRLRSGGFAPERVLDLHGRTVAEARTTVFQFIERAGARGHRCLLIIHGKGASSNPPSRLKSCVYAWLQQHHRVIALHSARTADGGAGATYLLLRNS